MGVPVIGCSFGSIRELMSLPCNYPIAYKLEQNNKTGDMCAGLDVDSLAYTLKMVLSEKNLLKDKRVQASKYINENHSLEISVRKLLKIIGAE